MVKRNTAPKQSPETPIQVLPGGAGGKGEAPLDATIHERNRLAIVSALAVNPKLSFSELKKLLSMTDGNLSVHAQKLEEAGYLVTHKSFQGRKPRTEYELTAKGKRALNKYLEHMEQIIHAVRET